jgi:glutamine amidotransferase
MGDVVAVLETDPPLLRCALHRLDAAIDVTAAPGDDVGVGYYENGKVLLRKRPVTTALTLEKLGQDIRSDVFVTTWHHTGPDGFREESVAPFRFRNWLFAGKGQLVSSGELANVMAELPEFLLRALAHPSEAEVAFFTTLAHIYSAGHQLDHPEIQPEVVATALASTLSAADARAALRSEPPTQATALMSNGRMLVAVRRGKPLFYGLLEGFVDCPVCEIDRETIESDPRVRAHRMLKAVCVTTRARKDGVAWIEVPEGHVLSVGRNLAARITPLPSA